MEILNILLRGIFGGVAAVGFGVLFNVPRRTLLHVFLLGALSVMTKTIMMELNISISLASFTGAAAVGFLSLFAAHDKKSPPLVFAIPAVIPLVPGIFTYRMMTGLIRLTTETGPQFNELFAQTVHNGLKATFVIMALSVGVSVPHLLLRKESFHEIISFSRVIKSFKKTGRKKR